MEASLNSTTNTLGFASEPTAIESSRVRGVPLDRVKVWDLPTRVFHWSLASCCTAAVTTGLLGVDWMDWHLRFGVATLGLLAFRIVWGLVGPRYARFKSFPVSPRTVLSYFRNFRAAGRHAGHSPSGAIAVFAFILVLLVQVISGLFTSDSIATEGPLVHLVSETTVTLASRLHQLTQWAIYAMVGLHLGAVLGYWIFKQDNLLGPMITGYKRGIRAPSAVDGRMVRAAGLLLLSAVVCTAFWLLR